MGNTNETKTSNSLGRALVPIGLLIAALGAVLVIASMSTGNAGAPLSWGMLVVGMIVAVIGFGARVLTALEKR